jgi:hypothetical protein
MCTVTYIPLPGVRLITSNRDESPARQSHGLFPSISRNKKRFTIRLMKNSGGSWIALEDQGRAVCLLNGAKESFIPNPPYRMSRGQVSHRCC